MIHYEDISLLHPLTTCQHKSMDLEMHETDILRMRGKNICPQVHTTGLSRTEMSAKLECPHNWEESSCIFRLQGRLESQGESIE